MLPKYFLIKIYPRKCAPLQLGSTFIGHFKIDSPIDNRYLSIGL